MTTYFVDSSGADANDGLSTSTPWKTLDKVNSATLADGDTVLFKRGNTFRFITPGTASQVSLKNLLTLDAYGAGAAPVISGGAVVTTWTPTSGGTYSSPLAAQTRCVTAAGVALKIGTGTGTLTANQYFWSAGLVYVNLGGTDPNTVAIEAAQAFLPVYANAASGCKGVTIQNLEFHHGNDQMIRANLCTSFVLIQNCTFKFIACNTNSGTVALTSNTGGVRVTRCTYDSILNDGVFSANTKNLEFSFNTITNIGFDTSDIQSDGIQIEDTSASNSDSTGAWIHHNTIDYTNSFSVKGCVIVNSDPSLGGVINAIVENNTLIGGNYAVAAHANNLIVRFNVCKNQTTIGGISCANTYTLDNIKIVYNTIYGSGKDGIVFSDGALNRTDVIVAHNTIYNSAHAQLYFGSPISGTIANNVCWWTVQPSLRSLYILSVVGGQTLVCDCNDLGTVYASCFRLNATAFSTLATWQVASTFDTNSVTSDPQFVDPANGVFTLKPTSPAIQLGMTLVGAFQTSRDIGAFRYQRRSIAGGLTPALAGRVGGG